MADVQEVEGIYRHAASARGFQPSPTGTFRDRTGWHGRMKPGGSWRLGVAQRVRINIKRF
jgi:hypothetical protein